MPPRRLDRCRHCHRPFGRRVQRAPETNDCIRCHTAYHRAKARDWYYAHKVIQDAWPEPATPTEAARQARAKCYQDDISAGKPINFIPAGILISD